MTTVVQVPACADCGSTNDGRRRVDGSRFGYESRICKRCYDRLRIRDKRSGTAECDGKAINESPKNSDINLLDHQGLVYTIALRYRGRGLDLDDLVQEGQFGLFRAREKFDPTRGFKFITYAKAWVEHFIQRAIQDQAAFVRVPIYVQQKVRKGDRPDTPGLSDKQRELLASAIRASSVKVARGSDLAAKDLSLADIAEERTSDFPSDDDVHEIVRAVLGLDSRLRRVLRLLYGLGGLEPMTLREAAAKVGVTRERVRQLRNEALSELRSRLNPLSRCRERRAG